MEDELAKQIGLMSKTLEIATRNLEACSKSYQEAEARIVAREAAMVVLEEALKRSLSENDQQIDDLAKVTAAQMILYQAQQQQIQGQQGV